MRNLYWSLAALTAAAVVGCSANTAGQSPTQPSPGDGAGLTPDIPTATGASLGDVLVHGGIAENAVAIYTLSLNAETLDASLTPKEVRQGQANDDVTDLNVSCYLTGASVTLDSVTATATTIDIGYTFMHPFICGGSATLGAPLRAVVMVDNPSATTYFPGDGDIRANTGLVANAYGYIDPGTLINTTGFTANVFPYQTVVDEVLDNRVVHSNGGIMTGNFPWGPSLDCNWTGYGWLHKGDGATQVLSLNKAALVAPISIDLAFLAKYAKPNAGSAVKTYLAPPDPLVFGYRVNHGAIDLEKIEYVGETGGFTAGQASSSDLTFNVRDWDAMAAPTASVDLSADTSLYTVAVGEQGEPTLEVSIPAVLGATSVTFAGAAASGTGVPGNELVYTETVSTILAGPVPGTYTGLLRATDPEESIVTTSWHFGFDCVTGGLAPALEAITYQAFDVVLGTGNDSPTATATLVSPVNPAPLPSGSSAIVDITGVNDTELDPVTITVDWGNGGGPVSIPAPWNVAVGSPYLPSPGNVTGPAIVNLDAIDDPITVVVHVSDGISTTTDYTFNYTLAGAVACSAATVGNVTVATLTGAGALRASGLGLTTSINGVRLSWPAAASATHYGIYRAPWLPGDTLAVATAPANFTKVGEVTAPTVTFDHNAASTVPFAAVDTRGNRWIYTVRSGCSAGVTSQPNSEYAVVMFQDWDGMANGTNIEGTVQNGWSVGMQGAVHQDVLVNNAAGAINGQSYRLGANVADASVWDHWTTVLTPDMSPADFATLKPSLSAAFFEFNSSQTPALSDSGSGHTIASRVGYPPNNVPVPGVTGVAGSTPWSAANFTFGRNFTTAGDGYMTYSFYGIWTWTTPAGNWYTGANQVQAVGFSQFNGFTHVNTNNSTTVGIHTSHYQTGDLGLRLDDIAYLLY